MNHVWLCNIIIIEEYQAYFYVYITFWIVQIGFEDTAYSVSEEDGTVELAVRVLSGDIGANRDITVTLSTTDGTAVGKQNTYVPMYNSFFHKKIEPICMYKLDFRKQLCECVHQLQPEKLFL